MKEEEEDFQAPPPTRASDMENGIFNIVVTLTRHYSMEMPAHEARARVAEYLDRLAQGLRTTPDPEDPVAQREKETHA